MPPLNNPAKFKKVQGLLTIDRDTDRLYWQGDGAVAPAVQLKLSEITNVQATPKTATKLMIKIFTQKEGESYMFQFSARAFLDSCRDMLSAIIRERTGATNGADSSIQKPSSSASISSAGTTPVGSASVSNRAAAKSKTTPQPKNYSAHLDTKLLLRNLSLQQEVIRSNPEIRKTFEDAVIRGDLSNEDFWSTRLHILRGNILATSQRRGPYNVLSTIKRTVNSDNQQVLSLSVEKIQDLYEQYPIVYQAYKDNVPPMSENNFWEDFFSSRLFRRLRGDKLKSSDPMHPVLDKYLDYLDNYEQNRINQPAYAAASRKRKLSEVDNSPDDETNDGDSDIDIPFFLNIEGNEENDPQRMGNRPDMTMRSGAEGPSALTLLKSMNHLSQKMVYGQENSATAQSSSTPTGISRHVPMHDRDESHLMTELLDRSLQEENEPKYLELNMKTLDSDLIRDEIMKTHPELFTSVDGSTLISHQNGNSTPINGTQNGNTTEEVSSKEGLKYMNESLSGSIDLQDVSKAENTDPIKRAQKHITRTIKQRSKEGSDNRSTDEQSIEAIVQEKVSSVHSTSIEYLRHFWIHFLSGDPAQALAINMLVSVLKKSLVKINEIENRENGTEYKDLVVTSLQPLVNSITKALETYQKALNQLTLGTNGTVTPTASVASSAATSKQSTPAL